MNEQEITILIDLIFFCNNKGVSFGPVVFESASALPIPEHCLHLVQHK